MKSVDEEDRLMVHVIRHTVNDASKFIANVIKMKQDTDFLARMDRALLATTTPQDGSSPSLLLLCFTKKRHVKGVEAFSHLMYGEETTMMPSLFNRPVEQVTFTVEKDWEREATTPEAVILVEFHVKDWDTYKMEIEKSLSKVPAEMERFDVPQFMHLGATECDDGKFRTIGIGFCRKRDTDKFQAYFNGGSFLGLYENAFTVGIIPPVKSVAYEVHMDERKADS
eukprot:TRINITY_DN58303_c0_g1_i1.p1 TRINITY_DN58303_c0_g1~~TRINITY_DN58303_c0_g1_i1.p1  ORF type:complete len:225 (+),score=29.24 TRINITY_DN58303_c0_g1_i1:80-754(+)